MLFFFKQKTAYEMRISDWSSDVCSSDLPQLGRGYRAGSSGRAGRTAAVATGRGMIELVEQNAVLQGFIDKWLAVQPQQRIALAFVDGRRYPGHVAPAALEQELPRAPYGIREPQVDPANTNECAGELAGRATSAQ